MIRNAMAMAGLTLKEASRRRIFVLLILFGAALISSAAFMPVITPDQKLRVVEMWAIRATSLFGAVIAIVVTALALPLDFARRRIYNLASKPISRLSIFLGRFLGFAAILWIYVLLTFALTVGYIRLLKATGGAGFSDLKAEPRVTTGDLKAEWLPAARQGGPLMVWLKDDEILAVPPSEEVDRRIVWTFPAFDAARLPDPVTLQVEMEIYRSYSYASEFYLVVDNPAANERYSPPEQLFMSSNVPAAISVPRRVLVGGPVTVALICANPGYEVYVKREGAAFFEVSRSFELNVAKCFAPIFLEGLILMSVSLAASAWLSAPVSMLVGVFVFILGLGSGFLQKALRTTQSAIEQAEKPKAHQHGAEDIPAPVLKISAAVTKAVLKVVPVFDDYDQSQLLMNDVDIPAKALGGVAASSCLYWLVPAAIGLVLLQFREFQ